MSYTCSAPCIINIAGGFFLVFCGQKVQHKEPHSVELIMKGRNVGSVTWLYNGEPKSEGGISPVAVHSKDRCGDLLVTQTPFRVEAGRTQPRPESLLSLASGVPAGFSCEEMVGHPGSHRRTGVFHPFDTTWHVIWP